MNEFYSMTLLNSTGDITLTWDDADDEAMRKMIQAKIDEGFSFFILETRPSFLKLLGKKKVHISDVAKIRENKITLEADMADARVLFGNADFKMGDAVAEKLFKEGKVSIANMPQTNYSTVKKSRDTTEIMKSHTVATPRIVAG